jgi:hypothetical protein
MPLLVLEITKSNCSGPNRRECKVESGVVGTELALSGVGIWEKEAHT